MIDHTLEGFVRLRPDLAQENQKRFLMDYVQLACAGQHSVSIDLADANGDEGRVIVWEGELWSAHVGEHLTGEDAFHTLGATPGSQTRCRSISENPGTQNISAPWQAVVVETARRADDLIGERTRTS